MSITLEELPERYRKQAMEKLQEKQKEKQPAAALDQKRAKYNNIKTEVDGIKFDSQKEAQRFLYLREKLEQGEITDLTLQHNFTLTEGYTLPNGHRVMGMKYVADFVYRKDGKLIVEDVKSKATRTAVYQSKRKMMLNRYGIEIMEV